MRVKLINVGIFLAHFKCDWASANFVCSGPSDLSLVPKGPLIEQSPFLRLMNNSFEELLAFQRALKDLVASVDATYAKQYEEFFVGLEGSFGSKHVTPRTMTARLLGSVVCVEGIVTKCEAPLQCCWAGGGCFGPNLC